MLASGTMSPSTSHSWIPGSSSDNGYPWMVAVRVTGESIGIDEVDTEELTVKGK